MFCFLFFVFSHLLHIYSSHRCERCKGNVQDRRCGAQRGVQHAALHPQWPLPPSSKARWLLPEQTVGLTRPVALDLSNHLRASMENEGERKRGRRGGETNKEVERFGQRGVAAQMWVAYPSLVDIHTPLSGCILTLRLCMCECVCVFCNRRTVQLSVSQSNSWLRSVLHPCLNPSHPSFSTLVCSLRVNHSICLFFPHFY